MSIAAHEGKRNVIPRWRSLVVTASLGELDQRRERLTVDSELSSLRADLARWEATKSLALAGDLIGAALVLGETELVTRPAEFLLERADVLPPSVASVASLALGRNARVGTSDTVACTRTSIASGIRHIRSRIREYPRDSLARVEMARLFTLLGAQSQAEESMLVALSISPDSRHVLRSAARLWVHFRDPERAHDLLRRSSRTREDPWLMAAEIAVADAAGRRPEFVSRATRIIERDDYEPFSTSELASAVATRELQEGKRRVARKLFEKSLRDPTENAQAQASWVSNDLDSRLTIDLPSTVRFKSPEATAWAAYGEQRWQDSIDACRAWLDDQPFSNRPAIHGSYIALMTLDDPKTAIDFAERSRLANPRSTGILNNLAVAQALDGTLDEAEETFAQIDFGGLRDADRVVCLATQGLLSYRRGDLGSGFHWYVEATQLAAKLKDETKRAMAAANEAIEASRAGDAAAPHRAARAAKDLKRLARIDTGLTVRKLEAIAGE